MNRLIDPWVPMSACLNLHGTSILSQGDIVPVYCLYGSQLETHKLLHVLVLPEFSWERCM
jgi:hypothetical protein